MNSNTKKVLAGAVAAVSAAGLLFIGNWEGKRNAPYKDIAGIWTVCYGSTGAHVLEGGRRTDEQCVTLLQEDAQRFVDAVNRCTPAPKNQNQFDAMTSLSFNIGTSAYCGSTFARKFNECGECAEDQFVRWSYARVNGQSVRVQGLLNRRLAERILFLTPVKAIPEPVGGEVFVPMSVETQGQGKGLVPR